MNISRPFILRPVATTLLMAAIILAGYVAYRELPVSALPTVDYPTIQVRTFFPGASPEVMASSVTAPLERQFGQMPGLTRMTSTSSSGSSIITLQFALELSLDVAEQEVQAAINAAFTFLPRDLPIPPVYSKVNPADAPILTLALTSDAMPLWEVEDLAETRFAQKISQLPGVGLVSISGGQRPAVRIHSNPAALASYGLTLEDVRSAITAANVNQAKGSFDGPRQSYVIGANDQLLSSGEYRDLFVAYRNGAPVQLSDVADPIDYIENTRQAAWMNKKPAVILNIQRQPGANVIAVVDRIKRLMPQLQSSLPATVRVDVLTDRTTTIRASVRDVQLELLLAVVLVVLVIFLFLRSLSATTIPSVAVPLSLVGTFGVMYLIGFSLNNLTLMALTISTGFVVDDAIVMIENIARFIEQGDSPLEAALKGSEQIGFTILSLTVSLIAVLIPLLFMGDVVGRLFREFAVTLGVTILLSAVVSLTLTPMMCARILKRTPEEEQGRFYRSSQRFYDRVIQSYGRSLRWVLDRQTPTLIVVLVTLVLTVLLYIVVPKGFFPVQDTGLILGISEAPQSVSFAAMSERQQRLADVILRDRAVESLSSFIGIDGTNTTLNSGRILINLKPLETRKTGADEVIHRLREELAKVEGITLYLQPVQDLTVDTRISRTQYHYSLEDPDISELNAFVPKLIATLRARPELQDVSSDQQDQGLRVSVTIDRGTASRLGITPQLIDDTLYDAFGQRQVSTIFTQLNQYRVVLAVRPEFQQGPDFLKTIYFRSATGGQVPLDAIAKVSETTGPLLISRQGQFPAVTVSFNLAPGVSLGEAVGAVEASVKKMGMPASVQGSFQGTAQAFLASLTNEPLLILAALITVYIVLGVLYESYIHPITILSTLPSAGVGAVLALIFFRTELSVIAVIGIILLIGIVKKNGIMMVDFALEAERKEGKSPVEAIYQASLLRFRPIMMTTLAALLGALPLALGTGVGSELRRPLGIAIVGGLIFSQMLTLYTTPVIYLYLDRLRIRIAQGRGGGRRGPGLLVTMAAVMVGTALWTAGCAVGPDYVRPPAEVPGTYKEAPKETMAWKEAGPKDHFPRGAWWEIFNDPDLNALVSRVSISNQNLATAEAQYRQALAQVRIARAGYYPTITAGASATRSRISETLGTGTFRAGGITLTDYLMSLGATWELDVWGRVRRLVEAGEANAQASAEDLESLRLSTQAALAQNYFQLRVLDGQKRLLDETVAAFRKTLELTQHRYASGIASRADVLQADTQLKTVQAQAIDLGVLRAQLEHAIATLSGSPAPLFSISVRPLTSVPPPIPVGVPSELLERRPDIAAAERLMAANNAQIGAVKAAYFPVITLNGSAGFESTSLSDWLTWPSRFWSLGPNLAGTLFEGGLRRAQTDQARAAYDASVATYRQTVLAAFQDVEDNLAALRILEREALAQDEAVRSARQTLDVVLNQYRAGIVSYLNVLTAQTALLNNEVAALNILSRRMSASVQLIRALGGGW